MNFDSDSDEDSCPLCLEELDLTDRHFKPCRCGYQICRFCWNRIMEESQSSGSAAKCPACRSEYTGKNYNKELTQEELLRIEKRRREKAVKKSNRSDLSQSMGAASDKADKAKALRASTGSATLAQQQQQQQQQILQQQQQQQQQQQHHARGNSADLGAGDKAASLSASGGPLAAASATAATTTAAATQAQQLSSVLRQSVSAAQEAVASGSRKNLNAVRVIQRNLVYVTNIATTLAKEDVLKRHEYFGQYGRIVKIVVNRGTVHHTAHGQSVSAYVTFHKKADALACILAVDGATLENRVLRASFGTTKYCNFFLRGIPCSNPECMYLHEIGDDADSFTKEDMQGGKSNFYEQIHAANMISKVPPPVLTGARRKTFLPPAGTVSGGFRIYGPKMNPERAGPAPLTLASVPVTTAAAAGKRSIATPNSAGATLGNVGAGAARANYAPIGQPAAQAAAAQSTWGTWTVPTPGRPSSAAATAAAVAPASISTPKSGGDMAWADIASKGIVTADAVAAASPSKQPSPAATAAAATAAAAGAVAAAAAAATAAAAGAGGERSRFSFASSSQAEDSTSDGAESLYSDPAPFIDLSVADWPTQLRALLPHTRVRYSVQPTPMIDHRGTALVENAAAHQPAPAHEVRALLIDFLVRDRCQPYNPPML